MLPKINKRLVNNDKSNSIYSEYEYVLKFDGCSKGNPGLAGAGAVIYYNNNELWNEHFFVGKNATNNHAEYAGLILGLQQAVLMGIQNLTVKGDSQLVINHMKGIYKCKSINLLELYDKAKSLESNFQKIEYIHIYRNENKRADQLSNIAIDAYLKQNDTVMYENLSDIESEPHD
jgi:ribonuclease HI